MLKTALIIPDCHIPYHHRAAYAVMIAAAEDLDPHEVVILGDYADFSSVSFHGRNPYALTELQAEVDAVNMKLDELDLLFPQANKVFIEGNHEFRLERYLVDKAPALFGLTSVEHVFKLNQRPLWKFFPWGPDQLYKVLGSSLYARHRPPAGHAKATSSKALCSVVYGDIHRIEENQIVSLDNKTYVSWCPGWLGNKRMNKVFNYVSGYWQWQLGFGVVIYNTETELWYHQKVPILEHNGSASCIYNGKYYEAK